jgi:hypothetical protein
MTGSRFQITFCSALALILLLASSALARPPIRRAFFDRYPNAVGTQLDDLPSSSKHCGVCHLDFNGGGPRNAYGLQVEIGIGNGLTDDQAVAAIENQDSDADEYTNLVEITNTVFTNTPTFPGLSASNVSGVLNIPLGEVTPYLTPMGSDDTTPPVVAVLSPIGGESFDATTVQTITYTATDENGVAYVDIYLSTDGGNSYKPVAKNEAPTGTFAWFVPNLPGTQCLIEVEAYDNGGNEGDDVSDGFFTIAAEPPGTVPTTLRDLEMPGTQPLEGAMLDDPAGCATCHGNYNANVEPWFNWRGSMMGNTMRDPLFLATLVIAEQDAPSAGDLCLRCHTPGGWEAGRSVDTSGGMINTVDRTGVQCDFCHRIVDRDYVEGVSPSEDLAVLAELDTIPLQYGNGQFINDPDPIRRGPRADADASHQFLESPIHRSSNLCATCHDVSSPVLLQVAAGDYVPTLFDEPHPNMEIRYMFPVERTFSEWSQSEYATTGVYAPQFAGAKTDGIVSTCQDCHMHDVSGKACNQGGAPTRSDLALHDLTGGNTFVPNIIEDFFPGENDAAAFTAGIARARYMLQHAARIETTPNSGSGFTVRIYNDTGHKLPSGYPEGRRIWINVKAYDGLDQLVFESGAYDLVTAELHHDSQLKIYEIHPGTSPGLAAALGAPGAAGPGFHFVLSDTVFYDDRIPPRGFTNTAFEAIQSPPVGYTYADGQYWDDTDYHLPPEAETATVTLYYQSTSKEYITFLKEENHTNSLGDELYDAWVAQGMSPPEVMAETTVVVNSGTVGLPDDKFVPTVAALGQAIPNPFGASTRLTYRLPDAGAVRIAVFDPAGRKVRTLLDATVEAGEYEASWDGRDDSGRRAAAGIYFIQMRTEDKRIARRVTLIP